MTKMEKTRKKGGRAKGNNPGGKRPADWTLLEKLRVVLEASSLSDDELGAFLRREGVHESQLEEWRTTAAEAFSSSRRRSKTSPEAQRILKLEKEVRRKDKALAEAAALLVLQKKVRAIWGGPGRRHRREQRQMIVDLLQEATSAGARLAPAREILGLSVRTVQRWQRHCIGEDQRHGPRSEPANKLSAAVRAKLLSVANGPEFRDLSPKQIVPRPADQG